jgi:hypothetical protein
MVSKSRGRDRICGALASVCAAVLSFTANAQDTAIARIEAMGGNAATEDYRLSAYLTGPVYGAQKNTLLNNEQLAFVGWAAVRPYHNQDCNLHVSSDVNASGDPGVSRTTPSFGDYPERRIGFNQLVNTGSLSASSASVLRRRGRG